MHGAAARWKDGALLPQHQSGLCGNANTKLSGESKVFPHGGRVCAAVREFRVRSLPKDDTKVTRAEPHVTQRQRGGKKLLKRRRDGAERRGTHARHANERGAEEGNFQTFATRVWRCEDLFTRGALFSNARRSRVRCLSAPLTSSFKRELSQTLDTWLAGWLTSRASNRLHASISYFILFFFNQVFSSLRVPSNRGRHL